MKRVINSSYSLDEDYQPYDRKIEVYSYNDPFGELVGNSKRFSDNEIEKAVKYWFSQDQKYPTCTAMMGLPYQGKLVAEWTVNNADTVRELADKYNSVQDVEWMLKVAEKYASKAPSGSKYPDQLSPYTLG